jgi:signal transduction histidine kinase
VQLATLFEKGTRAHTNSTYEGSGLGLFNVAETIRKYNGRVSVESQVDEGSRFTIFLEYQK